MAQTASYASPSTARSSPPPSWRAPKSKPIELLFRALAYRAHEVARGSGINRFDGDFADSDQRDLLMVLKAASGPGVTSTAAWAGELIATTNQQWVSSLRPSLFGELAAVTLGVSLDGAVPKIPGRSATPQVNGSFVGEAGVIPVRKLGLTSVKLDPKKLGVITCSSAEVAARSVPDIESVLRSEITFDTSLTVDSVLTDATATDANRPAGLRAGVSGLTPTAAGTASEKMVADLKQLTSAVQPASRVAFLVNPVQALPIAAVYADAVTVVASASMTAGMVIALDLDSFVHASSLPKFDMSLETILHDEDTNPLPLSATGTPNTVAAPIRSFFQTDVVGIRQIWPLNWSLRRTGAVAWMTGVTW